MWKAKNEVFHCFHFSHARMRSRGEVIGCGVRIIIYSKKIIDTVLEALHDLHNAGFCHLAIISDQQLKMLSLKYSLLKLALIASLLP